MVPRDEEMHSRWPPKHNGVQALPEERWAPSHNHANTYFELPPRRSASLPSGNPNSLSNGLQHGSRDLLQSLQLGQYNNLNNHGHNRGLHFNGEMHSLSSSPHESSMAEPQSTPSSLGLRGSSSSQLNSDGSLGMSNGGAGGQLSSLHAPRKVPTLSLQRDGEEPTADLVSTLRLSQGGGMQEGGGGRMLAGRGQLAGVQAGALLRRHSAPEAILGNVWPQTGNILGRETGHRGSLLGQSGPLPGGDNEELSPAESAAANWRHHQLSLMRAQPSQPDEGGEEGGRESQRSHHRAQPLHQSGEAAKGVGLESLRLGSGSGDNRANWERVVGPTIDFSDQLGPMPRGDSKKRTSSDLAMEMDDLADLDLLAKKRPKSPQGESGMDRRDDDYQGLQYGSGDMASLTPENSVLCKARAKRGCATHPRSIAERVRRTRISENMKRLQDLVPNINSQANTAEMLEEAVEYMKFLKRKVQELQRRLDASGLSDDIEWRSYRQTEDDT